MVKTGSVGGSSDVPQFTPQHTPEQVVSMLKSGILQGQGHNYSKFIHEYALKGGGTLEVNYDPKTKELTLTLGEKTISLSTMKQLEKPASLFQRIKNYHITKAHEGLENKIKHLSAAISIKMLEKAAGEGDEFAQNKLGLMYQNGEGVEKNISKAIEYHKMAADQGFRRSDLQLGNIYKEQKNYTEAKKHYENAGREPGAQFNLGLIYENGLGGIEKNLNRAFDYYKADSERGHPEASFRLGSFYESGQVVEKDLLKAIDYYNYSAAKQWKQSDEDNQRMTEKVNNKVNELIRDDTSRIEIIKQLQKLQDPYLPIASKQKADIHDQMDFNEFQSDTIKLGNRVRLLTEIAEAEKEAVPNTFEDRQLESRYNKEKDMRMRSLNKYILFEKGKLNKRLDLINQIVNDHADWKVGSGIEKIKSLQAMNWSST